MKKLDLIENMSKNFEKYKEDIKELLSKVLKVKIEDIQFDGIKKYEEILEYEFLLYKFTIKYEKNLSTEIYLKMIKAGKIKETIFCYWLLLYEEYLIGYKEKDAKVPQKAIITQITTCENNSSVILTTEQNMKFCAEVNLVELKKFITKNSKIGKEWKSIELNDEDILFIGKNRS